MSFVPLLQVISPTRPLSRSLLLALSRFMCEIGLELVPIGCAFEKSVSNAVARRPQVGMSSEDNR